MDTQLNKHKPVELNFRLCIIKRNYNTAEKYVSLNGIPGVKPSELDFNAEDYDVGEQFYAYLLPNKLFSGNSKDTKFTLVNINSSRPYLKGATGPGTSLSNCGSGGSKPPKTGGNSLVTKNKVSSNTKINAEMKNALKKAQKNHQGLKYVNITINDFGSPVVVFSKKPIDKWHRVENTPFEFPSLYGIAYAVNNRDNKDFVWICD